MEAGQGSMSPYLMAWQNQDCFFGQLVSPGFPFLAEGNLSHRPVQVQDMLPFATVLNGKVSIIRSLKVSIKCSFLLHQNFLDTLKF